MEKIISENVKWYRVLSIQTWGFRSSERVVIAQPSGTVTECISDRVLLQFGVGIGKYEGQNIFDRLIVGDVFKLKEQLVETQDGVEKRLIYEE